MTLIKKSASLIKNCRHTTTAPLALLAGCHHAMTAPLAGCVLAIDPGYDRCGVAIVAREHGKDLLLYSACIMTDKKQSFEKRISHVGKAVERLIATYKPSSLSIERLYFNTNQKTAMRVAEVRGALIYIAAVRGIVIAEYTPPQVKVAIAGWGRADKKQMIHIIPKLIHIKKSIMHDDEYDAIALGITHLASAKTALHNI